MALEKQAKDGMLSGMSAKQKGMMGAVVIIVLVVIWQVMGLVGGGGGSAPVEPIKPVAKQGTTTASPGVSPASTVNNQAAQQAELKQAQVANDARFMQLQQMSEQKYIGKITDLEDLKIQRAIAETNQAIAIAKLATVTAEKNISDLLTRPTAVAEVPAGTYANKLTNPAIQGESMAGPVGGPVTSASLLPPMVPTPEYTVISVSMQLGKWSAVIGYQGKLYNVIIGDVLAADNSEVVSISKNGVILRKDGKSRKISIMSAI